MTLQRVRFLFIILKNIFSFHILLEFRKLDNPMKHDTDRNVFVSRSLTHYWRKNASFIVQGRSYLSTFMPRHWLKDKSGRRCSVIKRETETETAKERERWKIHGPRWHSKRVTFISNEQLFKGHATSYSHTWYGASFLVFFCDVSHLAALQRERKNKKIKKRQDLDRNTGVTCARFAVRLAERHGMEEGSRARIFFTRPWII